MLDCERCGQQKKPPRDQLDGLCVTCEAETTCKHYLQRPPGRIPRGWKCAADVCLMDHIGHTTGFMLRIPCRWLPDGKPVSCVKFEATPVAICEAFDHAWTERLQRILLVEPLIAKVKRERRGLVVPCPTNCGGILHLDYSTYNGHVWGNCTTKGCYMWSE